MIQVLHNTKVGETIVKLLAFGLVVLIKITRGIDCQIFCCVGGTSQKRKTGETVVKIFTAIVVTNHEIIRTQEPRIFCHDNI
jgi:hypothetical protein